MNEESVSRPEDSFANVNEIESSREENLDSKQRLHTMKVTVGPKFDGDGDTTASPMKKKQNGLLRALNKRKAQSLLELNAATNKIPDHEEIAFSDATGLNAQQREVLENSR